MSENQISIYSPIHVPPIISAAGERSCTRFLEFFIVSIRNPNTRRAYSRAALNFLKWCTSIGLHSIAEVKPMHVATWIELETKHHSAPTAKQTLAALRHLFDWLVLGHDILNNPAGSVRGPSFSVRQGKTPILEPAEVRALLDKIDISTPIGLRDRALIGLMVYTRKPTISPGNGGKENIDPSNVGMGILKSVTESSAKEGLEKSFVREYSQSKYAYGQQKTH